MGVEASPSILLTTDAVGGIWTYTMTLAAGLSRQGVSSLVAVMGPSPTRGQEDELSAISGVSAVDTGRPLDWTAPDAASLEDAAACVLRLARSAGVRSVHLHSPALAAAANFDRPVVAVAHSCVGTWWEAVRGGPLPPELSWRAQATRAGLLKATQCVAPSRSHADATSRIYGIRPRVIHNGAEWAPVRAKPRRRLALAAGRLWDPAKNIALLDQVAARIDLPVLAAGPADGPHGEQVQASHLHLLGNLSAAALREQMADASVFLAPSQYEPFGLVALEAAQQGTPLLLSDIPVFRELWDGAAAFADPFDPDAWVAELDRLLDAPDESRSLGERAACRARSYSGETMTDLTVRLHRALTLASA